MPYVFLDVEPFDPGLTRANVFDQSSIPIRRPFMGLSINKETHAALQVISRSSTARAHWFRLLNSSDNQGESFGSTNFIITTVRHARKEAIQLVQSFSKTFLYTFGDTPQYLNVQGVLLKSENFPWKTEWLRNYNERMRASKTVQSLASVYLTVEDVIYEGQMLGCDVVDQADSNNMSPLTFLMYLTNVIYTDVGPARFPGEEGGEDTTRASRSEYIRLPLSERTRMIAAGMDPDEQHTYYIDSAGNLSSASIERIRQWELAHQLQWLNDGRSFTEAALQIERLINSRVGGFAARLEEFESEMEDL
jgi:hypothetical protein